MLLAIKTKIDMHINIRIKKKCQNLNGLVDF